MYQALFLAEPLSLLPEPPMLYCYLCSRRLNQENVGLLVTKGGDLVQQTQNRLRYCTLIAQVFSRKGLCLVKGFKEKMNCQQCTRIKDTYLEPAPYLPMRSNRLRLRVLSKLSGSFKGPPCHLWKSMVTREVGPATGEHTCKNCQKVHVGNENPTKSLGNHGVSLLKTYFWVYKEEYNDWEKIIIQLSLDRLSGIHWEGKTQQD